MFTPLPTPQPPLRALQTLRTAQEWQAAHTYAQQLCATLVTFAEWGALARAGRRSYGEQIFAALAEVSTCGDHLQATEDVQSIPNAPAYVQEAVRVVRANEGAIKAALAVYLAYGEDADQASAPVAAERRHAALLAAEQTDAYQRPLIETIRLLKILTLAPTDWTNARLQALPFIWARQGVQPQRSWETLIALMVIVWLAQTPHQPSWLATAIARLAEAAPAVHAEVLAKAARAAKQAQEDHLAAHGLAPEAIFALLGTPLGPVRGQVIAAIRQLLQNPEDPSIDLGPHTATLRNRARAAHNAQTV